MTPSAAEPPNAADEPGTEPTSIDIDREVGMTLVWPDGHQARMSLMELRLNCPCADCRTRRDAGDAPWPRAGSPQPLRLLDARLVGAYGIGLEWNDGHNTGIFSWDGLRRWSEE